MQLPTLDGFNSDDEEEGGGMGGGMGGTSLEQSSAGLDKSAFLLSQSGAFKLSDFQLRPQGGLTTVGTGELLRSPEHARPSELSFEGVVPKLEVNSIEDLEMLGELGSGASGTVHKARHRWSGTIVAVKAVTILEKTKRDQVVSELRIMLSHDLGTRWLVAMHNAFYEEAKVYTVLEFMDGGSVEDLVKAHAPTGGLRDEAKLSRLGRELLCGLNFLHRQLHQVHRDLKPANVMLSSSGAVKIADFGISSQLADTTDFAQTFVGTTTYMSPERLGGQEYSFPADIWAYGMIMFELATGAYPYPTTDGLTFFQLLGLITDADAPELPAGTFSAELEEVFGICLDRDPMARPTAKDLLRHEWLRAPPEPAGLHVQPPSMARSDSSDSRRDESPRSLERSRSNLRELELTAGLLGGMTLHAHPE